MIDYVQLFFSSFANFFVVLEFPRCLKTMSFSKLCTYQTQNLAADFKVRPCFGTLSCVFLLCSFNFFLSEAKTYFLKDVGIFFKIKCYVYSLLNLYIYLSNFKHVMWEMSEKDCIFLIENWRNYKVVNLNGRGQSASETKSNPGLVERIILIKPGNRQKKTKNKNE